MEHCGAPITHRGSSKISAQEIFQAANPSTTDQEFKSRVWGKARNYVFHGRRYPEVKHLVEANILADKLHLAVDKRIAKVVGLGDRERPHRGYEVWYRHFLFIEWKTADPAQEFAVDWPATHLARMSAEHEPGPAHDAASVTGINILDYESQSPDW